MHGIGWARFVRLGETKDVRPELTCSSKPLLTQINYNLAGDPTELDKQAERVVGRLNSFVTRYHQWIAGHVAVVPLPGEITDAQNE